MAEFKSVPIGMVLQEYGYITEEKVKDGLAYQKEHRGMPLGEILIQKGYVTEEQVLQALGKKLGMERVNVGNLQVKPDAVELVPQQLAEKYCMLPFEKDDIRLKLVVNNPLNMYALEDIRQTANKELELYLSEKAPLEKAIQYYYSEVSAQSAAKKANVSITQDIDMSELDAADDDDEAPIINLLNSLIQRAYTNTCSDIHIEPFENETFVRMRIDGVLVDYITLKKAIHNSLIARIKILGGLDIAERRVPQDGHFRMKIENEYVNMRVSVIPTVFGEKAVLRLLASNARIENSGHYGMNDENYETFKRIINSPNGIIYVTGPTGSGKSTTLYMMLDEMSRKPVNISTIEDPVEKNLVRINQMQVNTMAGLTFEVGLRALLRQDPDVILVGETRDAETASISIRAAITGHLVFSTLHTNSAAASIVRLEDMGMEPYTIASSVVGIVAQRLMRKLCPSCRKQVMPSEEDMAYLGGYTGAVYKACGCPECNQTGYRGRIAIHEIMRVNAKIREMITDGASADELQNYAVKELGMKTLKEQGIQRVINGDTSIEELRKIAYQE